MTNITTRNNPTALLEQMGTNMYRAAAERGLSLSAYLELHEDPSSEYGDDMRLDAFGRVLQVAGLRTRGVPEFGLPASTYEEFYRNENTRALLPEWMLRVKREVQTGRAYNLNTRALYTSADGVPGSWERPYADAQSPRWSEMIQPAIPIASLVALTTSIDADTYRAYYLTHSESDSRMVRIGEGAEVPRVKLVGGDQTISLYKFGRGLEATYEQLRRQTMDKLALHIRRMAVQAEVDKVELIIDTIVNGDGNSNSATVHDLTTLDSDASAGTLTLKGWLAFKMKFSNPYMLTTALANEGIALQMLMLNTGSANIPLVQIQQPSGFGAFQQINPGLADNVALGWTDDAPSNKIVAIDRNLAIERVVETGARIDEVERFVGRQTQLLVSTEVEGYAVIDENAMAILDVNA